MPITRKTTQSSKITNTSNKTTQTLTENMETKITLTLDSLIQNIQTFEGKKEQDIEFFLEQFDDITKAANLAPELKLLVLRSKLGGHAKQILITSPELREEKDYTEFKTKLIKVFQTKKSFAEAQQNFASINQKPNQSVEDFAKQFSITAQKYLCSSGHSKKSGARELLNTIKLTKFIDALRPDIAFEVHKNGPETFEEACEQAKKIEIAINANRKEINTTQTNSENTALATIIELSNNQNAQINSIQQELNNLKLNSQVRQSQPVEKTEERYCHICKTSSHSTENCFYNTKNKNQDRNFRYPNKQFQRGNGHNFRPRGNTNNRPRFWNPEYPFYNPRHQISPQNFQSMPGWGYSTQNTNMPHNSNAYALNYNTPPTLPAPPQITFPQENHFTAQQTHTQQLNGRRDSQTH